MHSNYSMTNNILILTEAGKNIGLGHYTRCSALRQAFEAVETPVQMLVYQNEYDIAEHNIVKSNWLKDIDTVIANKELYTVIVDSYLADANIYKKLQTVCKYLIAFDDYNRISYPCSLVINPNVFFCSIDYSNQTAKCIGGKDYVILREEFRNKTPIGKENNNINNILITIGGSDFRGILPKIIESCLATNIESITAVIPDDICYMGLDERLRILPSQSAESMYGLIQKAQIVISACGQTLHELASMGKATLGICLDVDQIPNQQYYLSAGFLPFDIQWDDSTLSTKIKAGIAFYDSNENSVSATVSNLFDKNGVLNIVSVIKKLS